MASSFQRKSKPRALPRGTRASAQQGQLVASSGVPSLDYLLGGGLIVGTVILVEEDAEGCYADVLLRLFLGEGVAQAHTLVVAAADKDPNDIVSEVPRPENTDAAAAATSSAAKETTAPSTTAAVAVGDASMNIAWRYQNAPKVQAEAGAGAASDTFGHRFDLSKTLGSERGSLALQCINLAGDLASGPTDMYARLRDELAPCLKLFALTPGTAPDSIARVAIHSLGSSAWYPALSCDSMAPVADLLHALRGLVRTSACVCMVTMPTHLLSPSVAAVCRRLSDTVVAMHAFPATRHGAFKDYDGLFRIVQVPRLNGFTLCAPVEFADLVFKLKRSSFVIETLHLPPEEGEDASRSTKSATTTTGTALCQPNITKRNPYDF